MKSLIRVYLFPDTSHYILSNKELLKKQIENETNTFIDYFKKDLDSYFEIEGGFESVHRARIMLQEIEKNIYKECFENSEMEQ
jgi:hypothetical protein